MSLRKLPELRRPDGSRASNVLADKALKMWSPIQLPQQAQADDPNTISILDIIGYDYWDDTGVTATRIGAALRSIGANPVTVQINSPGGDFMEGVTIYNMLRAHPAKVTVQIIGMAASAAATIAMAGDEIQIAQLGFMMIHNTQWVAAGDRHVMHETGDIMQVFDQTCAEMYAERSGVPVKDVSKLLDAETWYGGQAAVDAGFADSVVDFETESRGAVENKAAPLYRLEQLLASGKPLPRSERRKLMKELLECMPGAASQTVTPSADDQDVGQSDTHLTLALARMKLARA